MRRDAHYGDAKYQAASKYLRVERLHVDADDPWTTQRRKYIGGGKLSQNPEFYLLSRIES